MNTELQKINELIGATCGLCMMCDKCINPAAEIGAIKTHIDEIINIVLRLQKQHGDIIPFHEIVTDNAFPLRLSIHVLDDYLRRKEIVK